MQLAVTKIAMLCLTGLVGLAITYSLSVTNLLGGVVMFFTETEKQLVSVERAHHYITKIPYEKWDGSLFVSCILPDFPVSCILLDFPVSCVLLYFFCELCIA